jgi:2-polyprenyl-3-methyl-5-hydroxy-6-metoxy-1,4-benzoquinol methylase
MHVIEHIPDLNSFFIKLMKLAKKDTIVYFSLPNIESYNYRRNKEVWGALNPMEHTWHFSKETFKKLIKHFLPDAELLCYKTSWVWKPRVVGFLGNILIEGDQLEFVVKI